MVWYIVLDPLPQLMQFTEAISSAVWLCPQVICFYLYKHLFHGMIALFSASLSKMWLPQIASLKECLKTASFSSNKETLTSSKQDKPWSLDMWEEKELCRQHLTPHKLLWVGIIFRSWLRLVSCIINCGMGWKGHSCVTGEKVTSNINSKMRLRYLYEDRLAEWKFWRHVGELRWVCDMHASALVPVCPAIRAYGKLGGIDTTYHPSGGQTAMFSLPRLWIHTLWPNNINSLGGLSQG